MGRSAIVGWTCCMLLSFASGCGTFSRFRPTAWYHNVDRGRKAAAEKLARHNPFRRDSDEIDGASLLRRDRTEGFGNVADDQFAHYDAETQQMIAEELHDASPREREQLTADLNGLEPALIRQILKLRRMRIQMEAEHRQTAENRRNDSNRPLPGLGAGFPGSERRDSGNFTDSQSFAARHRQGRDSPAESDWQDTGVRLTSGNGDYGHSPGGSANQTADYANSRRFDSGLSRRDSGDFRKSPESAEFYAPGDRQDSSHTNAGRGGRHASPEMSRPFGEARPQELNDDSRNAPAGRTIDPAYPGEMRPLISAGHVSAAGRSGRAEPDSHSPALRGSPTGFIQTGETSTPPGRSNPLQISGIQTAPSDGARANGGSLELDSQDRYLTSGFGRGESSFAAGPSDFRPVPDAAWHDSLRRLIVVAEERAQATQTAWEQAERIPPSSVNDPAARQQFVAARKQDYVRQQVYLRMLYLMSGQQARSLERILGLEPAEQEFWTQMLWSMANYFDFEGIPNEEDRAAQTIAQLRSAVEQLQEKARLEIRNVNFCRKISSFGNFEPFTNDTFRPKQPVLIYAEIENFASERGSDGMYRTLLQSTIEIHTAGGQLVQRIQFDPTTDLCQSHRNDYFHSYEIQIPAEATGGPYVLTLLVEDKLSKRVTSYSRNFTVE